MRGLEIFWMLGALGLLTATKVIGQSPMGGSGNTSPSAPATTEVRRAGPAVPQPTQMKLFQPQKRTSAAAVVRDSTVVAPATNRFVQPPAAAAQEIEAAPPAGARTVSRDRLPKTSTNTVTSANPTHPPPTLHGVRGLISGDGTVGHGVEKATNFQTSVDPTKP